jgi:hypothetical protein
MPVRELSSSITQRKMKTNRCYIAGLMSVVSTCVAHSDESKKKVNVKTVGTAVSEDYFYKSKPQRSGLTEQSDAIASLRQIKNRTSKDWKNGPKTAAGPASSTFVVAWVNGDVITNIDVEYAAKFVFLSAGKGFDKQTAQLMVVPLINAMIEERILIQCAHRASLRIPDEEVDSRIAEIRKIPQPGGAVLDDILQKYGISMAAFKEYIRGRITIQTIMQSIAGEISITNGELDEAMAREKKALQTKRYIVTELIFNRDERTSDAMAKKNAEISLGLIMNGFPMKLIAEVISSRVHGGDSTNGMEVRENAFEKNVRDVVREMTPGECSGVIKTTTGYMVIYLHDVAEPGKTGLRQGRHQVLHARLNSDAPPLAGMSQSEGSKFINGIAEAGSMAAFKEQCDKNLISVERVEVTAEEDPELAEMAMASRYARSPSSPISPDGGRTIDIYMYESTICGAAQMPSREEIAEKVAEEQSRKEAMKAFNKVKSMSRINVDANNLRAIFG